MPVLECKKLNKSFGKKHILKDVDLVLNEGDILGFIGPNGAGKTTTIKLILGLQTIDSGTVTINGYDIEKDFVKAIKEVGAIVENPDMYTYLSGYDNLKLSARLYNIKKNRIDEVVKLVGLENRINDKVSKYSLGMKQRLGIALAILNKPKLLILDEPTNGLDPEGIKEMRNLLKLLAKKEKMAILVSSHILSELDSFCTKITIIQNGVIVETNDIKKIKKVSNKLTYLFEVSDTSNINLDNINIINEKEFKIETEKENIPDIIVNLVKSNIKIYKVYEERLTLEEAFLRKTGGNIID